MGIFELSNTQREVATRAELTYRERIAALAPIVGQVTTAAEAYFGSKPPSTQFTAEKPVQVSDYLPVRLGGKPSISMSIEKGGTLNPNTVRAYAAPLGAEFEPGAAEKVAEFDNTDPSSPRLIVWPVDRTGHSGARVETDLLTAPPETFQHNLTEVQLLAQVIGHTFHA